MKCSEIVKAFYLMVYFYCFTLSVKKNGQELQNIVPGNTDEYLHCTLQPL